MFGTNPLRKRDRGDGQTLWVQDVFYTLQGEGPFAGEPAVFVRLAGCNLACWFCDTDFESSTWKPTLRDLRNKIHDASDATKLTRLVVLTGGEPLRQNIVPLLRELFAGGYRVQIETAGTLWDIALDGFLALKEELTVVCSPKTGRFAAGFKAHAYKYIISATDECGEDGLPMSATQVRGNVQRLARPPVSFNRQHVYVQPMDEYDAEKNAANLRAASQVALKHGYRLCVQMHKLVGVP